MGRKKTNFESRGNIPLDRFFEEHAASLQRDGDEPPPRKRQRLQASDGDEVEFLSKACIPLARVTLNFTPTEDADGHNETGEFSEVLEVGLTAVSILDQAKGRRKRPAYKPRPTQITFARRDTLKGDLSLTLDMVHDLDEYSFQTLAEIALMERRYRRIERGVARAECILSRSRGPAGVTFRLQCSIVWLDGESAFGPLAANGDMDILSTYYPQSSDQLTPSWTWSPQDFYDVAYSTPADMPLPSVLEGKILKTDLYPFQKRAVAWMMERETAVDRTLQVSSEKVTDVTGADCLVSYLQGIISSVAGTGQLSEPKGGILAEEMGLGKTCELIALTCLNPRASTTDDTNATTGVHGIKPTGATLVVTPQTILQQWKDEIKKHAPDVSIYHYEGMVGEGHKYDEQEVLHSFATKQIVLTTYSVLAREVHFALDPPDRFLRKRERAYKRTQSPLIQMHWWRVCLDEAQMVESGVSAAAQVAALLPRENAWAVSGTPLRKNVEDLFGLLIFLRYQPFCDSSVIRKRLITQCKPIFQEVFGRLALRHSKEKIRNEMRLPPQRRVVLTMSFTTIEEQNYKGLFEEMCEDVGCAVDGSPLREDWDPQYYAEKMRSWLLRLRQTCLHPQVGGRNRKALGRGNAPLRTVAEVGLRLGSIAAASAYTLSRCSR